MPARIGVLLADFWGSNVYRHCARIYALHLFSGREDEVESCILIQNPFENINPARPQLGIFFKFQGSPALRSFAIWVCLALLTFALLSFC